MTLEYRVSYKIPSLSAKITTQTLNAIFSKHISEMLSWLRGDYWTDSLLSSQIYRVLKYSFIIESLSSFFIFFPSSETKNRIKNRNSLKTNITYL